MAGICCGIVAESEPRRRRIEIRQLKFVADTPAIPPAGGSRKRRRGEEVGNSGEFSEQRKKQVEETKPSEKKDRDLGSSNRESAEMEVEEAARKRPRFGVTSVCGRRRDMEDAVSIHPSFCRKDKAHFFGVFDGHGCSHVAVRCRDRLHEIVKEGVDSAGGESTDWKGTFERSFEKMDKEVHDHSADVSTAAQTCRCELRTPHCDAVGSTAVVCIVTPDRIIVSNCGDSRAVLSRNGVAVPLSSDHKPDRPDELMRIENAGGRVIYWDGARVLGMLAMSRAIGDSYLKPYVISEPEVTVVDRTPEDECLILGSDGLWDVVSNETACGVAGMCLSPAGGVGDKQCSDATLLLTKLALARHSTDNVSVVVVDLRNDVP